MVDNGYKIVLIALVELLKQQGLERAGEVEGLNAYQALAEASTQARAYGVPLADIGLADFDIDSLLTRPSSTGGQGGDSAKNGPESQQTRGD